MTDADGAAILRQIEAAGRKVLPMHEVLAEADPELLDAFNRFLTRSIYRDGGLPEATKEMLLACVCIAVGSAAPVVAGHCRKALAAGLERDALLQALTMTSAVAATRTLAAGTNALLAAEAE